jgi:hypothetical protein
MKPTTTVPEMAARYQPEPTYAGQPAAWSAHRAGAPDRAGARLVARASQAGVSIGYLGTAPLFSGTRAYTGPRTDWLVSPVTSPADVVIPGQQRAQMQLLDQAGVDFPLVYIAHEIRKGQLDIGQPGGQLVEARAAARAVGPVPLHPDTVAAAEQAGRGAQLLIRVLAKALPVAGFMVAAPFVLAGAAVGALVAGLDPVVFGVVPAGSSRARQWTAGQDAAWYVLAQWDWPDPLEPTSRR